MALIKQEATQCLSNEKAKYFFTEIKQSVLRQNKHHRLNTQRSNKLNNRRGVCIFKSNEEQVKINLDLSR